jgi:hypothetical protein
MSYLVKFRGAQGETWEETFVTEQQVLECKDKDSIVSIQKIDEELTLEQLQEQVDYKAPSELQEANFNGKHIKVGDIVYFSYEWIDHYEGYPESCYETYYGRIKSIIRRYGTIRPTIIPIAYDDGTLLEEDDYNPKVCPREVQYDQINEIYDVCTPKYFDKLIQKAEDAKDEHQAKMVREHNRFCKERWMYQYTDADDRKVYECDGLLYKIGYDYPDLEVEKVTDVEYDIIGNAGTTLVEKKPTYKERYLELKKWQEADELQKEIKELKRYKNLFENCRKLYLDVREQAHSMCEKLEDLEDSLKRTTCQAECYKHKEADRYRALLNEVVMYCEDQDLKNDITACNVISMIEKEGI